MAIITKPATIYKAVASNFSLNKSELAAVSSVAADSYYGNFINWKNVILYYSSSTGNQREFVNFDATHPTPTADFLVSTNSLNNFEINQIIIKDFDGGYFIVPRSELPTVEFDVSVAVPGGDAIPWTFASPDKFQNYGVNGGIEKFEAGTANGQAKSIAIEGDFTLRFIVNLASEDYWMGYNHVDPDLSLMNNPYRTLFYGVSSNSWGVLIDNVTSFAWIENAFALPWSPAAAPIQLQNYTVTFSRTGSLIQCTLNNGNSSATFDVENYSGPVYPLFMFSISAGTGAKLLSAELLNI